MKAHCRPFATVLACHRVSNGKKHIERHMPKFGRPLDVASFATFLDSMPRPRAHCVIGSGFKNCTIHAFGDIHGQERKHSAQA